MRVQLLILVSALVAGGPAAALSHDEGVIRLGAAEVAAGAELEVRGEKLPKDTEFTLVLRGALETHTLSTIRTDSLGAFTARLVLPRLVSPGAYVLRALAPDGDESGRADVRVLAATAPSPLDVTDHHEGAQAHEVRIEATAEPLDLPQNRGPLEWALVLAISAGSLAGGLTLLRRG